MKRILIQEEKFCRHCRERFHIEDLVYLNTTTLALSYKSLVCAPCKNEIHAEQELESVLKELKI